MTANWSSLPMRRILADICRILKTVCRRLVGPWRFALLRPREQACPELMFAVASSDLPLEATAGG